MSPGEQRTLIWDLMTEEYERAPVYFLLAERTGLIKIGFSTQPGLRRKGLENEFGPLTLLGLEVGGFKREHELHRLFAEERVRGEWFVASPRLVAYIVCLHQTTTYLERVDSWRR